MRAAAEARDRLPRGAVPRHRQGPRRRPLRARRGRRRGLLPRAGPVALRRAPGRVAGAQPPAVLGDRAEEGHLRPEGDPGLRPRGGRPDAPRLPVPAHRRRRARHESEAVELVEVVAVPRLLRACQARAAPRPRGAGGPRGTGRRDARRGARELLARHGVDAGPRRRRLGTDERQLLPAPHARRDRLAHAAAGGARAGDDVAAGGGARGDRARRQLGAHLHAAPAAQLRAHHRAARPDGPQHRRRAHHAARGRLEPRHLPGARGHRARRSPTAIARTRSSSSCGACCSCRRTRPRPR